MPSDDDPSNDPAVIRGIAVCGVVGVLAALSLALCGCHAESAPGRQANADPFVRAAVALWQDDGLNYPQECRDQLSSLLVVVLDEPAFREACGYCGPSLCREADLESREVSGRWVMTTRCMREWRRFGSCAGGCYRERYGAGAFGLGGNRALVVHEERPQTTSHEILHALRHCSGMGVDPYHRDTAFWRPEGRVSFERRVRDKANGRP